MLIKSCVAVITCSAHGSPNVVAGKTIPTGNSVLHTLTSFSALPLALVLIGTTVTQMCAGSGEGYAVRVTQTSQQRVFLRGLESHTHTTTLI